MQYRLLGRTGLYVSEICLGTMTYGGKGRWEVVGRLGLPEVQAQIKQAFDAGVNFIDTANVYSEGGSETLVGQALSKLGLPREDLVVATKVRVRMGPQPNRVGLTRAHIMNELDASLRRLQLDHVDLYQIHGVDQVTPLEETLRALEDIVRSGRVRYLGVSNHAAWQIAKALGISARHDWNRFESVQAYYSIAGRELEREIVPVALDQGLSILVWSPTGRGPVERQVQRRQLRPRRCAPHHVRLSARRSPPRVSRRRSDAPDRGRTQRFGRARRARMGAAAARHHQHHRRRQEPGAARRQHRRGGLEIDRRADRRSQRRQQARA